MSSLYSISMYIGLTNQLTPAERIGLPRTQVVHFSQQHSICLKIRSLCRAKKSDKAGANGNNNNNTLHIHTSCWLRPKTYWKGRHTLCFLMCNLGNHKFSPKWPIMPHRLMIDRDWIFLSSLWEIVLDHRTTMHPFACHTLCIS